MHRRSVLSGAAAIPAAAAALWLTEGPAAAAAPGYVTNRAPLRPDAFIRLAPGAVKPGGWLSTQLNYQLNGINGRMTEISHFLQYSNTGWITPNLGGWEELPYWLKGYSSLGYVTGNATVQRETARWIKGVMATQASDGYFGPTALRTSLSGGPDFWPHMPMLHAIRTYQEFTDDAAVVPFFTRFFQFVNRAPLSAFNQSWGAQRWADTLEVVFWVYNRTGDAFLLDLARKIHANSANYMNNLPTLHNVNLAQGFREPAVYGMLSGDNAHTQASYNNYNTIMNTYGQFPGGGFAGDENARPGFGDPRQGFETCGVVEFMLSHEIMGRITGDPVWGDRVEDLAFNSLPAGLDPKQQGIHYVTSANTIALLDRPGHSRQFDNTFAMQAYMLGIDNYRCCPHNYGMGWPYYVEEMWAATPDNGLAAQLHGPSTVTAAVGDGTAVTITAATTYPFGDTITYTVNTPKALAFPLYLRIPRWCTNPTLTVNGAAVAVAAGPTYGKIARTWNNGDQVVLRLPMQAKVRTWAAMHNSVSVDFGALTFSLAVTENWSRIGGSDAWPTSEVRPGSAWNYGLALDGFSVTTGLGNAADPFTPANAPIRITTNARKIPNWKADADTVVTPLQDSPTPSSEPVERVTLIPMGAARLRITSFPRIGDGKPWLPPAVAFRIQNQNSGKVLGVDQMSLSDSARVVQFGDTGTADHLWQIVDNGDGWIRILNVNSGKVLGVSGMSTADSAQVVQFADNGTADHLWQVLDNGNGYVRLRNKNSGKVLGVSGMSTADSANVVQFADNGTADHNWRLIPDGTVKLQVTHTNQVLAVNNMATTNGAQLVQYPPTGTADHVWKFVDVGSGYFRIVSSMVDRCVDIAGQSTADGALAHLWDYLGTGNQQWRLAWKGAGVFALVARHDGKVLEVQGGSTANSATVGQWADAGLAHQRWRIIPS
ncbi:RICIN domain-containing protein [Actinoplanes sp. LDG1-06]|uniref:RICIN domain-containing protein n=1 Tax=Paractinoplanes ovalisporus TaxID=2810368 RepID=A0ABS2ALN0_9ACTN|nr:RICIN domain-containing protein [Actinoplanes ovalisporus]MBM2620701.1 RICIN domain-containing protein [Actinoplanes ovalisporus]